MACHYLFMKDEKEFYKKLKERDFELISKMTRCIMSAIAHKKSKIDVFEVTFKNTSSLTVTFEKFNYKSCLEHCLQDYSDLELYEECIKIKKCIDKL